MGYGNRNRNRVGFDWILVSLYFLLCIWGWISIYAAVYNEESASIFSLDQEYGKQGLFIVGGLLIIFFTMITNYRIWTNFAPLWYALSILLLILVLFVGKKIGGARSWFGLGGFSLQPSEVGKFATALMLAFYASLPRKTMKNWRDRILGLSILGVPGILIALAARYGFNFGLPEFDLRGVPSGYARVLHRYSTRWCRFGGSWLSTSFKNCIACSWNSRLSCVSISTQTKAFPALQRLLYHHLCRNHVRSRLCHGTNLSTAPTGTNQGIVRLRKRSLWSRLQHLAIPHCYRFWRMDRKGFLKRHPN